MPTNDRFIQSIVELLDKLIDHQSRNATLLSELKSSLGELRSDSTEALLNLREKLPNTLSREQEDNYRKLSSIVTKIEDNNDRIADNIKIFEEDYKKTHQLHQENALTLGNHTNILTDIKNALTTKKEHQDKIEETVKNVDQFIISVKNKKTWIALIVAGMAALATAMTAIIGSLEAFKNFTGQKTQQVSPNNQQSPQKP